MLLGNKEERAVNIHCGLDGSHQHHGKAEEPVSKVIHHVTPLRCQETEVGAAQWGRAGVQRDSMRECFGWWGCFVPQMWWWSRVLKLKELYIRIRRGNVT